MQPLIRGYKMRYIKYLILLILLIPVLAWAKGYYLVSGVQDTGECANYLICQNFEGTGYDKSETWTETVNSGTVDEDYTTVILRGSQSLYLFDDSYSWSWVKSPNGTYATTFGFHGRFYFTGSSSDEATFLGIYNSSNALIASLLRKSNNSITITHGSVLAYPGTYANTTEFHFWMEYIKSSGSNDGVLNFYSSVNQTKPGSPTASITTGDSITDAQHIQLRGERGMGVIIDQIYTKGSAIGSVNP